MSVTKDKRDYEILRAHTPLAYICYSESTFCVNHLLDRFGIVLTLSCQIF